MSQSTGCLGQCLICALVTNNAMNDERFNLQDHESCSWEVIEVGEDGQSWSAPPLNEAPIAQNVPNLTQFPPPLLSTIPPKYPFNAPCPRQMYPRISMNRRKSSSFMVLAGNHNRCLGRLLSSGNGRSWSGRLPKWALIDFNFVVTMPARQGATKKLSCQRIQKV